MNPKLIDRLKRVASAYDARNKPSEANIVDDMLAALALGPRRTAIAQMFAKTMDLNDPNQAGGLADAAGMMMGNTVGALLNHPENWGDVLGGPVGGSLVDQFHQMDPEYYNSNPENGTMDEQLNDQRQDYTHQVAQHQQQQKMQIQALDAWLKKMQASIDAQGNVIDAQGKAIGKLQNGTFTPSAGAPKGIPAPFPSAAPNPMKPAGVSPTPGDGNLAARQQGDAYLKGLNDNDDATLVRQYLEWALQNKKSAQETIAYAQSHKQSPKFISQLTGYLHYLDPSGPATIHPQDGYNGGSVSSTPAAAPGAPATPPAAGKPAVSGADTSFPI